MKKEEKIFKAETKELLNLMIHSIYTNKEIFLRELISNANDAIDKLKFKSLTDTDILKGDNKFKIEISVDKDNRTLTITDNGIGMTYEEVDDNIGTIAKSGSKLFKEQLEEAKKGDIDKIKETNLTLVDSEIVSSPAIKELPITLECKVLYKQKQVLENLPEDIVKRDYPQDVDGTAVGANRDSHTAYYAEIVAAYIIEE